MNHLLQEVGVYRTMFSMHIELIPRATKGEPEASITIGTRPTVRGYSSIVSELKAAVSRISAVSGNNDPVNDFFQNAIHKKDIEDPGVSSGRNEKDLASAFTRATAEREKRRPQRGVSRNKNGEPPPEEKKSTSRAAEHSRQQQRPSGDSDNEPAAGPHHGDVLSARKIMAAAAAGDAQDNSDLAGFASDPIDAKYWSNQFVTAGI